MENKKFYKMILVLVLPLYIVFGEERIYEYY